MEQLLHYVWKHKLFPLGEMKTTDGLTVEVIDPGLHNRNSGPDFFNAKVKINGTLWVGNVEIHDKSSDWFLHGHDHDTAYDNVVLHVTGLADADVTTAAGQFIPQMVLQVPDSVRNNYEQLLRTDQYPPCYQIIPHLSRLTVHSWMAALQTDNGEAFEQWAAHIPLTAVAHHRDDLFQIEAIFLGQAGLLDIEAIPERYQQDALNDGYFAKLRNEYQYLAHKFSLQPMNHKLWRFLRLRPQNFPHIRLAQLANLYYEHKTGLSQLLECKDVAILHQSADHQHLHTHALRLWAPLVQRDALRPCLRPAGTAEGRRQPHHPSLEGMRTRRADGR